MLDGVDEWGNRKINGLLENGTIVIITGIILKEVADSLSLSDSLLCNKTFAVTDSVGLADVPLKGWTPQISDSISLLDQVSTPTRILQALDAIGLSDMSFVNKTLIITDQIALAEVVEVGKGGVQKTKLFLIIGDLAIQLTKN
jgi:hypothetical protein